MRPVFFAPPVPDATVEIAPGWVSAALLTSQGRQSAVTAVAAEPLEPGLLVPGFASVTIKEPDRLSAAVRAAVGQLGTRVRRVALVVPDATARVSLVRLEQVPSRKDDLARLIEWQVRKGVPFPAEDARVSFVDAAESGGAREFLATVARAGVVAEYERACAAAGLTAGIVDTASVAALNLRLSGVPHGGDWLFVHARPDACAVAVLRGDRVLFFRTRPEDGVLDVVDFVHQAVMYYQDRLEGRGFEAAYVAGGGTPDQPAGELRRVIEERIRTATRCLDPGELVSVPAEAAALPGSRDVLTSLVGMALRAGGGARA